MTADEFYRQLRQGQVPEVVVLCGSESYLVEQACAAVRAAIFGDSRDDFNDNLFEGKSASAETVIEAAVTLPVFAERRLVTVKDVQQWPADELELLLQYVKHPLPETCLLLTADKLDNRRKSTQQLKKTSTFVDFKPLSERDLPNYVRRYLDGADYKITADALQLFCSMVSSSLHEVHSELEKLMLYLGQGRLIDIAEVRSVVSRGRSENIFEFGNAVGRGDVASALQVVSRLTVAGEAPVKILFLLVRHFRQLWKVRELQVQKVPEREIATKTRVPFFVLGGMIKQGRRFSRLDFLNAYDAFLETDLAMKSSGADADALLEVLILRLAKRREQ
jgi:DNA polymerase-3 subunit delta